MITEDGLNTSQSVFKNLNNLRLSPPIKVHDVKNQSRGLSAADISNHSFDLAYSPEYSCDICLVKQNYSDDFFACNISDPPIKHKNRLELDEKELASTKINVFKQSGSVTGLNFTANDNILLSCCLDGSVNAFSANTFMLVESYVGTCGACSDIHGSSDSSHFATAWKFCGPPCNIFPYTLNLYKFETKYPIVTFLGHHCDIECVRFHSNPRYIATASRDKTIKLWCIHSLKDVRCFQDNDSNGEYPKKLAFSPDGKYLASAYTGSIKIWDLQASKVLQTLEISNSTSDVLHLCYSASGDILVSGGSNGLLHVWDTKQENLNSKTNPIKSYNFDKKIYCIKYSSGFFSCLTSL